jgi:UDPglucose 6-dehydrogenase
MDAVMEDKVNNEYNMGIIGYGFLGTAVVHGFSLHAGIKIYDRFKVGFDTLEDTVKASEFLFFCLPTPMFDDDGSQDLSIVEGAVRSVHDEVLRLRAAGDSSRKIAIIKSTVLPGTNRKLQAQFPELTFVNSPEFLTARSNRLDFICASRHIFGGEDQAAVERVVSLFRHRFGNSVPIYTTNWETAETVKYAANCFFAVKVNYFNFIYDLCDKLGVSYNDVKDMVLADGRIGRSHCDVPGHDGMRAVSGSCFPKDVNALIDFSKGLGINPRILEAAWKQNLELRPGRDWETLPGVMAKRAKQ